MEKEKEEYVEEETFLFKEFGGDKVSAEKALGNYKIKFSPKAGFITKKQT
jgi:hypothetical protein